MKRATWTMVGVAAAGMLLLASGGCGKPKPGVKPPAQATAEQTARDAREAWMRAGTFAPVTPEIKQKVLAAFDAIEALPSYRIGLYSDQPEDLLQFDGDYHQGDWHLGLTKRGQVEPWEFFIIRDRFYSQDKTALQDNGPGSRPQGEAIFLPLLRDLRVSAKQTLNGEFKDLGLADLEGVAVHKYDFRIQQPVPDAPVVTAVLEIDEARNLLLHAVVGHGAGSESGSQRYQKVYQELILTEINKIGPITLPDVPLQPPVSDKDADHELPGMPGLP